MIWHNHTCFLNTVFWIIFINKNYPKSLLYYYCEISENNKKLLPGDWQIYQFADRVTQSHKLIIFSKNK